MTDVNTQQPELKKIAQLPDGTEIHFPGHVSDDDMQNVVQKHLGLQPSDGSQKLLKAINDAVSTHMAHADNAAVKTASADREQEAKYRAAHIDTLRGGQLLNQKNNQELIGALVPLLKQLTVNAVSITRALNTLAQVIMEVGREHNEIMGSEREIITDDKNQAKKMRINRRKK